METLGHGFIQRRHDDTDTGDDEGFSARRVVPGGRAWSVSGRPVPPQFGLDVTPLGGAAIIRVSGRLTAAGAGPLTTAIDRLLDSRPTVVVVDLHDLHGLDAVGVATFVELTRRARTAGTALRIIGNDPVTLLALMQGARDIDVWDTSGRLSSGGESPVGTGLDQGVSDGSIRKADQPPPRRL